jgi:hypothetical protein
MRSFSGELLSSGSGYLVLVWKSSNTNFCISAEDGERTLKFEIIEEEIIINCSNFIISSS